MESASKFSLTNYMWLKITYLNSFRYLGGGDGITSPKLVLCDEISRPVTKLSALKIIKKRQKGTKFWKNFFDEKVLITLFLRLKYKKLVLCHCFMLIQGVTKLAVKLYLEHSLKPWKLKLSGNFVTRHSLLYETKLADGIIISSPNNCHEKLGA